MPTQIMLPQLDGSTTQATIEHYFHAVGDAVTSGQPLAVVLTERFEWEIPATATGTIAAIVAAPGTTVDVGAPLVQLDAAAEPNTADAPPALSNGHSPGRPPRATPVARKIATVHDLDLATISGSGRGGLITRADVLTLAQDRSLVVVEPGVRLGFTLDAPVAQTSQPVVAQPAAAVKAQPQIVPHPQPTPGNPKWSLPQALATVEIDLSAVLAYVAAHAPRLVRRGIALTPTSCVAAAVVASLGEHRLLNSVWSEDGIILRGAVHLAVKQPSSDAGAATQRIAAGAAELNVQGLARALSAAPPSADHTLTPTFTLAESGTAHWSQAVVPSGQSAMLTLGAIEQRPVVVERAGVDTITVRPLALLTLAYDARIVTLPQADTFLQSVKQRVEQFSAL